jgi:hypothetical protein
MAIAAVLAVPLTAYAQPPTPTPNPTADTIYLRKDCTGIVDCMTQMSSVTAFLWSRTPIDRPMLVDIGPGDFDPFDCPVGNGHVTLRGSGRETTRIVKNTYTAGVGAVTAWDCVDLTLQDLSIVGTGLAIRWIGGGESYWFNVDVRANATPNQAIAIAWQDGGTLWGPKAKHVWFSSTLRSVGAHNLNLGISASNSENWFYGSEIEVDLSGVTPGPTLNQIVAVSLSNVGEVRMFGGAIRARSGSYCGAGYVQSALLTQSSVLQMNGGVISATAKPDTGTCSATTHATTLEVGSIWLPGPAGLPYANTAGTAFVLSTSGSGIAARVKTASGGKAESPFMWPPGTQPPVITSVSGADLFVETDCADAACNAQSNCNGGGTETHLMVYSANCSSKWFDATQGACRP